jgi:hypothetical protein
MARSVTKCDFWGDAGAYIRVKPRQAKRFQMGDWAAKKSLDDSCRSGPERRRHRTKGRIFSLEGRLLI